jgi:hypothetical protein
MPMTLPKRSSPRLLALVLSLACAASHAPRALAAGDNPGRASPVKREQAQTRFERGKKLFADKKYGEALEEFRASFDLVASPNTHLFMARCLRETGKLVEAYVEFGRAAIEAKELAVEDSRYAKAGESAVAERNELAKRLGFVTITVENARDATTLKVAGEEVRRAGWGEPVPALPGNVEISVETPPSAPVVRTIAIAAGAKESVTIDASAATAPTTAGPVTTRPDDVAGRRRTARTIAYVTGAIGVVGLATFTIAGLSARSTFNSLQDQCKGPCPPSRQSDIDSGQTKQTIANVGLVIGIVGLATGTTLFLLGGDPSKPEAPHTALSIGPGTLSLQGSF